MRGLLEDRIELLTVFGRMYYVKLAYDLSSVINSSILLQLYTILRTVLYIHISYSDS